MMVGFDKAQTVAKHCCQLWSSYECSGRRNDIAGSFNSRLTFSLFVGISNENSTRIPSSASGEKVLRVFWPASVRLYVCLWKAYSAQLWPWCSITLGGNKKVLRPTPLERGEKISSVELLILPQRVKAQQRRGDCVTSCCRDRIMASRVFLYYFFLSSSLTLTLIRNFSCSVLFRGCLPFAKSLNYNYRDWSQFSAHAQVEKNLRLSTPLNR